MKRHIVRAGITAAAIAGLSGGCQSKPQPQNLQSARAVLQQQPLANVTPPAPAPVAPEPVFTPDPKAATSQALIYKAQSYTREMEPLLNKRVKKAGEPTDVDFLDPSDFRLGPAVAPTVAPAKKPEPAVQVVAIAHPVTASTPTLSNQGTALASGGSADAQAAAAMASSANYPRSINDAVTERAAVLSAKLRHIDDWNGLRRKWSARYSACLKDAKTLTLPYETPGYYHIFHLIVILFHPDVQAGGSTYPGFGFDKTHRAHFQYITGAGLYGKKTGFIGNHMRCAAFNGYRCFYNGFTGGFIGHLSRYSMRAGFVLRIPV